MATKAIEDKKHEMEATMVNLGDKVGSNIQQGLNNLPVAGVAGVMGVAGGGGKRFDGEDMMDQESSIPSPSFQVTRYTNFLILYNKYDK